MSALLPALDGTDAAGDLPVGKGDFLACAPGGPAWPVAEIIDEGKDRAGRCTDGDAPADPRTSPHKERSDGQENGKNKKTDAKKWHGSVGLTLERARLRPAEGMVARTGALINDNRSPLASLLALARVDHPRRIHPFDPLMFKNKLLFIILSHA